MVKPRSSKGLLVHHTNRQDRIKPSPTTLKQFSYWYIPSLISAPLPFALIPRRKQGVGWLVRKIIYVSTISLKISQYEEDSITHVNIDQTAGVITTTEERTLDWQIKEHTDGVFGTVDGQSRWVKLEDVDDDEFLKTGWDDLQGKHIQSYAESRDNGWTANQVCSFSD